VISDMGTTSQVTFLEVEQMDWWRTRKESQNPRGWRKFACRECVRGWLVFWKS